MIVHRCDVCRAEFPASEAAELTTVMLRFNMEKIARTEPNYVQGTLDLCNKVECRRTGLEQIFETILGKALEKADLKIRAVAK